MNILNLSPREALEHHYTKTQRNPIQEIRDTTYAARIYRRHLYILDPERRRQDWVSGDVQYDSRAMESITPAWVTIEHMLAIFDDDGYLSLENPNDKKRIYEIVTLHMKCCLLHNQDPIRGQPVGVYALDIMDRFCAAIFEDAKFELSQQDGSEDARTRFNKSIGAISSKETRMEDGFKGAKRDTIFSKDEITDDFMTSGLQGQSDNGDDDDLFNFGENEWT